MLKPHKFLVLLHDRKSKKQVLFPSPYLIFAMQAWPLAWLVGAIGSPCESACNRDIFTQHTTCQRVSAATPFPFCYTLM